MYIFLLIIVSVMDSNASGMISAWEPFKTKTELGPHAAGADADRFLPSRDEFTQTDKIISMDRDTADRKDYSPLNVLRFHNFSISFSRTLIDELQIDGRQASGKGSDKLYAVKTLPSMFLNSPYRDTFESLGKIFEPQVNLSIEF
ncbi:MAG: hypothetical protein L7F78_00020 [Syntrophales bacterium LBB04]|nr:hypothetical protein [Syntrophales bacterium LBB04]